MSKYIPKVGDKVLSEFGSECLVLYVGEEHAFVKSDSAEFSADFDYFEPIPTKADVEREQLMKILSKNLRYLNQVADAIQNAGFTIPKKVKRSEIFSIVDCCWFCPDALTDDICKLLGDLVEYEAND